MKIFLELIKVMSKKAKILMASEYMKFKNEKGNSEIF